LGAIKPKDLNFMCILYNKENYLLIWKNLHVSYFGRIKLGSVQKG
jgi:hypothetical protein